jgi:hypothetical protein
MLLKMPSTSYPSPMNSSKHMCSMVKCSNHITHPFVFFVESVVDSPFSKMIQLFMRVSLHCIGVAFFLTVVRASIPRMLLDDVFEQKNEVAKNAAEELEKVMSLLYNTVCCFTCCAGHASVLLILESVMRNILLLLLWILIDR